MPKNNPLDAFAAKGKTENETPFRVNGFPSLGHFISTFGAKLGAVKFDEAMENWRKDFERNMPKAGVSEKTVLEKAAVTVATETPSTPATPSNQGQLDNLADDFAAHIAADVVHRKDTPVVGESDEQILEKKTIGQTDPRYGRFTHMIQNNFIRIGESLTIPDGENMIVAGPFEVAGELIVDGYFASVDTPPY